MTEKREHDEYVLTHLGRRWTIDHDDHWHWFANDELGGRVGTFSTPEEAAEWIRAIVP